MDYNLLGFVFISAVALMAAAAVAPRFRSFLPPWLLLLAVALRIVGSAARYEVLYGFYDGLGDAVRYYEAGVEIAEKLWQLDFSPLSIEAWFGENWWGTRFMENLSGLIVALIGPTMRGEFLVFSLFSLAGLLCIVAAFRELTADAARVRQMATWVLVLPSLFFWPCSVGKEAVIILAIGLATLGYAGRCGRPRWALLAAGLALAFCIRPHVALVLVLAAFVASWVSSWKQFGVRKVVEGIVILAAAAFVFSSAASQMGLGEADVEGAQEYMMRRAENTLKGGSSVGSTAMGAGSLPMAFVNIWMRPFLWEAHNVVAMFSAAEILALWALVWRQRRGLWLALKTLRHQRLLAFAVPFLLGYTLMIGLVFGNLGIIARQRTPILPFVFVVLFTAAPLVRPQRAREAARQGLKRVSSAAPLTP